MTIGLIGKKIGMTREFIEPGISIPVTVLFVEKGRIIDVITKDKRGYDAIRIGFGKIKSSKTMSESECDVLYSEYQGRFEEVLRVQQTRPRIYWL